MNKAKVGIATSSIIYWSNKRRLKALKGQKLIINTLNNNKIFVNGDDNKKIIEKDDSIKVEYNSKNLPIELEVENKKLKMYIKSSFEAKIIGIGRRVPKIVFETNDDIIIKYISNSYSLEVLNEKKSNVNIKAKFENNTIETYFYSDVKLTQLNGLIDNNTDNLEYVLIPYKNLTSSLWQFFLLEITKYQFNRNLNEITIYKENKSEENNITFMSHRYHFEIIYKYFLKTLSDNIFKIADENLIVSIIGNNSQFDSFDREGILSVVSKNLSNYISNFGKYYNFYNEKIDQNNVNEFKEFIIAHIIANGFLKVLPEKEPIYIETLRSIQQDNSIADNLLGCIRSTLIKFRFFENSNVPSY